MDITPSLPILLNSSTRYLPRGLEPSSSACRCYRALFGSPSRVLFDTHTGADLKAPRLKWLSDCVIHYHQKESLHCEHDLVMECSSPKCLCLRDLQGTGSILFRCWKYRILSLHLVKHVSIYLNIHWANHLKLLPFVLFTNVNFTSLNKAKGKERYKLCDRFQLDFYTFLMPISFTDG